VSVVTSVKPLALELLTVKMHYNGNACGIKVHADTLSRSLITCRRFDHEPLHITHS